MPNPPDDLQQHTADRMAELGANVARNAAERKLRSEIKERLPRFLWPLIPGEGGSVEANVGKMAERKASDLLWSVGCTVGFFLIFGAAVCGMGGVVMVALWQSGVF